MKIQIKSILGSVKFEGDFNSVKEAVISALKFSTDLSGANLRGAKVKTFKVYAGLYRYIVMAILFQDGSRMVRMGCLWKKLEEWDKIGILESNISEFPNDGSDASRERERAFNFAKEVALNLK